MKREVRKKIETIMNDDGRQSRSWLHAGLGMASLLYGWGMRVRDFGYARRILRSRRLPCAVVSIGNLTVGGTGKTPMTIYTAGRMRAMGLNVAILSRGYGGSAMKKGGIVSDGRKLMMKPECSGDEPYMMAGQLAGVPVLVGSNRFQSGRDAIRRFNPDVLLLDDGFQHRRLERDLDIVMMDAARPLGNGYMLPRGVLRESRFSLGRCHAVVFTRVDRSELAPGKGMRDLLRGKPVFESNHAPVVSRVVAREAAHREDRLVVSDDSGCLKDMRLLAFSGIARNDDFRHVLENLECRLAGFLPFPDHHRYTRIDFEKIAKAAKQARAVALVTTEKDYVRFAGRWKPDMSLVVLGVKIQFADDRFERFLRKRLQQILNEKRHRACDNAALNGTKGKWVLNESIE